MSSRASLNSTIILVPFLSDSQQRRVSPCIYPRFGLTNGDGAVLVLCMRFVSDVLTSLFTSLKVSLTLSPPVPLSILLCLLQKLASVKAHARILAHLSACILSTVSTSWAQGSESVLELVDTRTTPG